MTGATPSTAQAPILGPDDLEFLQVETSYVTVTFAEDCRLTIREILDWARNVADTCQYLRSPDLSRNSYKHVVTFRLDGVQTHAIIVEDDVRQEVATAIPARYTLECSAGGMVDRADRVQVGSTVTLKFSSANPIPKVTERQILDNVPGSEAVIFDPDHYTIAVAMVERTLDDDAYRAFAKKLGDYLKTRVTNPNFKIVDPDINARMYPEFAYRPRPAPIPGPVPGADRL